MGTSDFAVPTLEKLVDQKEWEVIAVVTQPDRPSGRGRKLTPSPVKLAAEKYQLPTLQPEKVRKQTVGDQQIGNQHTYFPISGVGQIGSF